MKRLIPVFMLLSGSALWPQNVPPHTVKAAGEATVKVKPDQARISIGVKVHAATADDAVRESAAKTETLMAAMKSLAASSDDLRTTNYSVEPQYQYAPGQPPALTGYEADHTVELKLDDVNLVGKAIDTASKSGANMVSGIEFGVKDEAGVRRQAIAKATVQARANAESIVKALNLSEAGIYSAETAEASFVTPVRAPRMMMMKAMPESPATQIQSGDVEVHASVTVYLEVH